jgi:hypothetical protein
VRSRARDIIPKEENGMPIGRNIKSAYLTESYASNI